MFRPPRNARLEVLPKVHNISGIEVPIIGDLVLTDVEPVVEVKNESLSDLSTLPPPSPETWLKKFYRKRIFPRRLNFEPTEPLRPDSTESNRMWTSDVAEDPFGKLSLENNATTSSKDDKTRQNFDETLHKKNVVLKEKLLDKIRLVAQNVT